MPNWWRAAATTFTFRRTQTPFLRHLHTIQAIPREIVGRRVSNTERAQGRIPAVVYALPGDGAASTDTACGRNVARKRLVTTETKQIQRIIKDVPFFSTTTFSMEIRAGLGSSVVIESGRVLPFKVQKDAETGKIMNLEFVWADKGTELTVDVPIVIEGEDLCPGLKKGGYLKKIRNNLKVICPVEHLPQKIEVDVSNLDIGDKILMSDVKIHPSLKLLSKDESRPICKIATIKSEDSEPIAIKSEDLEPADIKSEEPQPAA